MRDQFFRCFLRRTSYCARYCLAGFSDSPNRPKYFFQDIPTENSVWIGSFELRLKSTFFVWTHLQYAFFICTHLQYIYMLYVSKIRSSKLKFRDTMTKTIPNSTSYYIRDCQGGVRTIAEEVGFHRHCVMCGCGWYPFALNSCKPVTWPPICSKHHVVYMRNTYQLY